MVRASEENTGVKTGVIIGVYDLGDPIWDRRAARRDFSDQKGSRTMEYLAREVGHCVRPGRPVHRMSNRYMQGSVGR